MGRHGAEQLQRAAYANLGLRVLESVLGSSTAGQLGTVAAEMGTAGTVMRFSRDAEREADRLGAVNVAAAGYDPTGMLTFFGQLDALAQREPNAVQRFFASHPSLAEPVQLNVGGSIPSSSPSSPRGFQRRGDAWKSPSLTGDRLTVRLFNGIVAQRSCE